jgi:hypothetical protein
MQLEIDTANEVLIVDEIPIAFAVLEVLTQPDPSKFYRFERMANNAVIVRAYVGELEPAEVFRERKARDARVQDLPEKSARGRADISSRR